MRFIEVVSRHGTMGRTFVSQIFDQSFPLIVTGTDTGVGKTYVTSELVRSLREEGPHQRGGTLVREGIWS